MLEVIEYENIQEWMEGLHDKTVHLLFLSLSCQHMKEEC